MRIGLIGFEFESPNKGCEALTYSFCQFLNSTFDNEKVEVLLLTGESLGRLPQVFPDMTFKSVKPHLKDFKFKYIKAILSCDCIFDVTLGDSFSDIYSKDYCLGLIRTKRIIEFFGKKYVLLPQTYGPFYDEKVRKGAIKVLKKADYVFSRDQKSIDYINEIGVKKDIQKEIDLAFLLPFDPRKYSVAKNKINVGINVSGLLWNGGFHSQNQFGLTIDYKKYICELLEKISLNNEIQIHLIPHVIDLKENPYDDDYQVLRDLHSKYPNIILAPVFETPIDAKSYIANMDCFIGSRMHSTIAAISAKVAVIPVSYSRKFEGLFDTLGYNYLINGREETTENAISKTIEWVENYRELRDVVCMSEYKINLDCKKLIDNLAKIF